MRLTSVRVANFKCIEDSEAFSVGDVTCLVGKNESGKTALLQALYKMNPDVAERGSFDYVQEYPRRMLSEYEKRHATTPENVVTTSWELTPEDVHLLDRELGPGALRKPRVEITKGYDNEIFWSLDLNPARINRFLLQSSSLHQEEKAELEKIASPQAMMEHLRQVQTRSERQTAFLKRLDDLLHKGDATEAAIRLLSGSCLPKLVYFSEYEKMPGRVSINQLGNRMQQKALDFGDRVFLALLDLAGATPEAINATKTYEHLVARLEGISNLITAQIFEYWRQNTHLQVQFSFDAARPGDAAPFNSGSVFNTRIRNTRHAVTIGFDERSAGFVWFFSFLVWFSQVKKNYGKKLIILLDEPGLGLHGRAQNDLLRYIKEKLAPDHQVIYTTHSPFMVDPENLLGARTVEDVVTKDGRTLGTKVGDRVFSTDKDTIFPLQAALGYDITQTLYIGKYCLLVEGPSDLLYLKWFSRQAEARGMDHLDSRWVITPCGGAPKIASFLALFGANELEVAVLADTRRGQKRKVADLKQSDLLRKGHVFSAETYAAQGEADIEDILGWPLYVTLVNACYRLEGATALPLTKPKGAATRVVEEVEGHFRTLRPEVAEFDHYTPAQYLVEQTAAFTSRLEGLDSALERFSKLFADLNEVLPRKP